MARIILTIALALLVTPAVAQDDSALFSFGNDRFLAGADVTLETAGTDDLFMAGESVRALSDITGTAHAAGRRVVLQAGIGQDVYAAGMDVSVMGPVAGDASLAGYDIVVGGAVGGDLRASGAKVAVSAPIAGYALLAGESVTLNSTIAGDVSLAAQNLTFGSAARIDGQLTLYEESAGALDVPDSVVPEDRIERILIENWEDQKWNVPRVFNWRRAVVSFLTGVVIVAAIAALIAAVVPVQLAEMRRRTLAAPFRSLWLGFLTQSALIGSAILFAMTIIGIFLAPASIVLALIGGFFGYVVGAYAFGVGLLLALGRDEPDTIGQRALGAGVGALVAGLIGLVPIIGWLFVLALTLAGIGAITTWVLRPAFFTAD